MKLPVAIGLTFVLLSCLHEAVNGLECYTCADYYSNDMSSTQIDAVNQKQRLLDIPSCRNVKMKTCPDIDVARQKLTQLKQQLSGSSVGVKNMIKVLQEFLDGDIEMKCMAANISISVSSLYVHRAMRGNVRGCQAVPYNTQIGCKTNGPVMQLVRDMTVGMSESSGVSLSFGGEVCLCDTSSCCSRDQLPVGNQCKANIWNPTVIPYKIWPTPLKMKSYSWPKTVSMKPVYNFNGVSIGDMMLHTTAVPSLPWIEHRTALECYSCMDLDSDEIPHDVLRATNDKQHSLLNLTSCKNAVVKACPSPEAFAEAFGKLKSVAEKNSFIHLFEENPEMKCTSIHAKVTILGHEVSTEYRGCMAVPAGTKSGCRSDGPLMQSFKQGVGIGVRMKTGFDSSTKGQLCICDTKACCNKGEAVIGKHCPSLALIGGLTTGAVVLVLLILAICFVYKKKRSRNARMDFAKFDKKPLA